MLLLAPSKGQTFYPVDPHPAATRPEFLEQSRVLIDALARLDTGDLAKLMQLRNSSSPRSTCASSPACTACSGRWT
jgi:cytoplasmic iron level regulating protein YaaA (DUF328/UPF0246 family)